LTLDDDVARELQRIVRKTGHPFKAVVNDALRAGLRAGAAPAPRRYRLTPASLGGVAADVDLNRALRLADSMEDEALVRKLELRK
jgi:hypothetical protein